VSAPDLVALPKAELHLHLEGSIRASTAAELADRRSLPMPPTGTFENLSEFVVAYERARDLIGSVDDLKRVATELVEDADRLGVVWSEVHLVPPSYAGRIGADEAVLEAVLDGFQAASTSTTSAAIILGINRGLGPVEAEESLRLALAYRDRGVVGLGLAGDEANHPAEEFADLFARARDAGLAALPHGGEGAGAQSVQACVEVLGARRVNHGVRAVEDPQVLRLLAQRQICLDICPTSNVALRVTPSLAKHPLPTLLEAGIPITLNSDCPLFCTTSAVEEYTRAARTFGLDPDRIAAIAETSLRVSSCPPERREAGLNRLRQWRRTFAA
jgi:adenosine deaminase